MVKFVRAVLLLSLVFSPTHHAYSYQCHSYFEDTVVRQIKASQVDKDWAPQKNVFADSIESTIVSGLTWLTLVQVIKHQFVANKNQPIFTESFWITLPTDIMLTLISHFLSLKEVPMVRKFLNGEFLSPRFEYFSRTLANTLVNSSVIVATWSMFGIDINSGTVGAAVTLCAAVYSVLQITKPFLFKTVPSYLGQKHSQEFQKIFPEYASEWKDVAKDFLSLDPVSVENHFVYALDQILLGYPIENKIKSNQLRYLKSYKDIQIYKIKNENQFSQAKLKKLKNLRRNLIDDLIREYDNPLNEIGLLVEIAGALRIDSTVSVIQSIEIHRFLNKTYKSRQAWLYTASFLDQAIAVGIAGGVFLYSTTHWAATGEIPSYLQALIQ